MATVHVFVSTGRFASFDEIREFVDPDYTEDGDRIPSPFITETGLTSFEPMCIEVVWESEPQPVRELLNGMSYCDQWLPAIDVEATANEAICVFEPNRLATPEASSLAWVGAFEYHDV